MKHCLGSKTTYFDGLENLRKSRSKRGSEKFSDKFSDKGNRSSHPTVTNPPTLKDLDLKGDKRMHTSC